MLFGAKEQLWSPDAGRSAELLQSQLERFEALLADLLEISRHDANVATLDAESADVCDLVLRAAADAEQLAARRGTRIEFRLPAASSASPRWTGAAWSGCCATCSTTPSSTARAGTWWSPWRRTGTRWRSPSATTGWVSALASSSSSSTASGVPTRPGHGPPAVPGWVWPSPWRTPGCTAGGCRPGVSRGGFGVPAHAAARRSAAARRVAAAAGPRRGRGGRRRR